jgi:hypothetical protein
MRSAVVVFESLSNSGESWGEDRWLQPLRKYRESCKSKILITAITTPDGKSGG